MLAGADDAGGDVAVVDGTGDFGENTDSSSIRRTSSETTLKGFQIVLIILVTSLMAVAKRKNL